MHSKQKFFIGSNKKIALTKCIKLKLFSKKFELHAPKYMQFLK